MSVTAEIKHTEASMLALLRARHSGRGGNGPEYAYLEHVRDAAGFSAKRTADALSLHLWPSRGHEMQGFEVKVSRSDWRREMAEPAKAEGWCQIVDRWWIVAPRGIVPRDELPPTWGLLETKGGGLAVTVQAPLLRAKDDRPEIGRSLLVCLLRAAGAGLAHTPDHEAEQAAFDRGVEHGIKSGAYGQRNWQELYERVEPDLREARRQVQEIEQALGGVSIRTWRRDEPDWAAKVAAAVRAVLAGEDAERQARRQLDRMASELERQVTWLREHAGRH